MFQCQGLARNRVRTLFVSDLHFGSKHAQAAEFLRFLQGIAPDSIYLVGDIIDGWRLQRRWHWEASYTEIFEVFEKLISDGVQLFYTPGNHDDFLRDHPVFKRAVSRSGIQVRNEFLHRTVDGRRFLVTHGDRFDSLECHATWLSRIGAAGYNSLLAVDRTIHRVMHGHRTCRYRLSAFVKRHVKRAVAHVSCFEERAMARARRHQCHGMICGHIHTPRIGVIDGLTYCNTGDWVENCTALIEDLEGRLRLVELHTDGSMRLKSIEGHAAAARDESVGLTY